MTDKQAKTIEALRKDILKHDSHNDTEGKYEYKKFKITNYETGTVYLDTTVGRKNDEGTMAETFCRTSRQIAIGVRGGCRLLNPGRFINGGITYCKPGVVKEGYWNCIHAITK